MDYPPVSEDDSWIVCIVTISRFDDALLDNPLSSAWYCSEAHSMAPHSRDRVGVESQPGFIAEDCGTNSPPRPAGCSVIDAVATARDNFSKLTTQARKMKSALVVKQVELDQITGPHQRELTYCKESAEIVREKVRAQSGKLRKCKGENEKLRRRNKRLAEDARAVSQKVEEIKHLQCDICMESSKNVLTRCGHGYCTYCRTTWLRPTGDGNGDGDGDSDSDSNMTEPVDRLCPICRRSVSAEDDVWPIYLEIDGGSPEVMCVDTVVSKSVALSTFIAK
jgi:Zinc finger, C3HC4 type (RING finger)